MAVEIGAVYDSHTAIMINMAGKTRSYEFYREKQEPIQHTEIAVCCTAVRL